MGRTVFELKSILTKHCLPGGTEAADRGHGVPFTFYWTKDSHELWLCDASSKMVNLTSVLLGGEGSTGKVSMLPGPPGPAGPVGPKGDVLILSESECATALKALREKYARLTAALELAKERNQTRKNNGISTAVSAVLTTIEKNSQ
ncbi:MAG: hypothetical protein ABSE40_17520 [Candidatus Sulfotelmatobacter sp.]|jgi:hypothetical protein